jgi:exodeoxyribonuclease VII large subunit
MVARRRERLEWIAKRPCLLRPEEPIERAHQTLDLLADRMERAQTRVIERAQARLGNIAGKLDALSPLKVLSRGYAAISTKSGKVVVKAADLATGDLVRIAFADATRMARIEAV